MLQTVDNPVKLLRHSQMGPFAFPVVPDEYTNWRDEQRAWREGCGLWSMSHHMTDLYIEGPDARDVLAELGVNDFEQFDVNQAKQFVACNPDGYLIGDAILLHLSENTFNLVGAPMAPNWVQYNVETGEYNASVDREENSVFRDGPPRMFRYQIQGPNAPQVMAEVTEGAVPDIPFFAIGEFTIAGREIRGLRHGMAGERGYELFGSWDFSDEIWDVIVDAGQEYGLQQVGSLAFPTTPLESGWLPFPLPAIYESEQLSGYREWLTPQTIEAMGSLGGSFQSHDITDYYLRPAEVGYGRFIDFDHDFVGREALLEASDTPQRTKVTLVWNDEDVTEVVGSQFQDEETAKYLDFPLAWYSVFQYDEVLKGGDTVGVSRYCGYTYNEREMLSLAIIDTEQSEPGTEVTLIWGEAGSESSKPTVEPHVQTEIRATVAPAPYVENELRM